jgi:hypothetical protein
MPLTVAKTRITSTRGSDLRHLTVQFNALLDTLRAQAVIYDADAGITATNFTANLDAGPQKIGNLDGSAVTS